MGTNDHTPNKSQRTKRHGLREVKETLVWKVEYSDAVAYLLEAVSAAGGYLGFGRNASGDCLLVYIKLDDWSERVPIESYAELLPTLKDIAQEIR